MIINNKNLKQRLDALEQKMGSVDYNGNHYVIVSSSDEMIDENRTFGTVTLYVLAVRAGDSPTDDNCRLPLYRLEWHYDGAEFQQLMEKYDNDWGALDWTNPASATPVSGFEYDLENNEVA